MSLGKCPVCKKTVTLKYAGGTVGGSQLYACSECGVILCPDVLDKKPELLEVK